MSEDKTSAIAEPPVDPQLKIGASVLMVYGIPPNCRITHYGYISSLTTEGVIYVSVDYKDSTGCTIGYRRITEKNTGGGVVGEKMAQSKNSYGYYLVMDTPEFHRQFREYASKVAAENDMRNRRARLLSEVRKVFEIQILDDLPSDALQALIDMRRGQR